MGRVMVAVHQGYVGRQVGHYVFVVNHAVNVRDFALKVVGKEEVSNSRGSESVDLCDYSEETADLHACDGGHSTS